MNQQKTFFTRTRAFASIAALGCSLVTVGVAQAADPMTSATGGNIPKGDRTFVEKAAIGGMTEVQASELAKSKGTSQAVKDYSAHMIADHTKANTELMAAATSKGVTAPGALDAAHRKDIDKLSKMSGTDFDKAYMKQMVADHKATVSLFEKQAKSGKDADLQAWAGKTLPTLQEHLKMAQSIADAK